MKAASAAVGRYLHQGVDEEISVALLAFNEAINSYDSAKGGFIGFAQTVIKRRLIDYFRRQKVYSHETLLSALDSEDDEAQQLQSQVDSLAYGQWDQEQFNENRSLEIAEFRELLEGYGIDFEDLPRLSPKHYDARDRAIGIARLIAEHSEYRRHLNEKRELPVKKLVQEPGITRKILERHRKYIIAVTMILISDWPYLQSYLLD
jgi:RNA polymerase sigma factor